MRDSFFKTRCDRCGASLDGGRTMSRFDTSCLCMRFAKAEQPLNASLPISATEAGIFTSVRAVQSENAPSLMAVTLSGMVTPVMAKHPLNAFVPMNVTQ